MEVRLTHVSLTIRVDAPPSANALASSKKQLPTIAHEVTSGFAGLFASKTDKRTKTVLSDFSGVFKPGSLTLVLGQPGSGKTSLLKLISGRLESSKTIARQGEVAFNGVPIEQFHGRLPQLISYVPQHDNHFPTLTVHETVAFAQAWGQVSAPHQPPKPYDSSVTASILAGLGLTHVQDTVVGDEMLRGVSGGEKKRVTIGEMDLQGRLVACYDEITTGLDSAATFDIVRQYRANAIAEQKVVVMALLQPAPEVFDLFDTVIVLNEGHVLYNGPRDRVRDYFRGLGFDCPPQRDTADFVMDLGTRQQSQYTKSVTTRLPHYPSEFADVFQQSDIYRDVLSDIRTPTEATLVAAGEQMIHVPMFYQPFWHNVRLLIKRDLLVMGRNTAVLKARFVTILISSLLHATLFYQLNQANVQLVVGIAFASVLFLALEQGSQIPVFQNARKIFYKQRASNLYQTSAYVLASAIAQLPVIFFQVVLFGSIVYWICGLAATAGQFIIFQLLLLLTTLAFSAWFFFLAAVTPNLHVAEPINLISLLMFILFAGFMIARNLIPDYFIWIYWVNPVSWCLRAIMINQFDAEEFKVCVYKGVDYCTQNGKASVGSWALSSYKVQPERVWLWLGFAYMAMMFVLFMGLSVWVLENVHFNEGGDRSPTLTEASAAADGTSSDSDSQSGYRLAESPREVTAVTIEDPPVKHERHFAPVSLAFTDLWYSVPKPGDEKEELTLLKGISGYAVPGTITALMGSSGAGKTTLMDLIAGRKTGGTIKGQIFLNGHPATDMAIRRCTAYCEQMDVHLDSATTREALTFSAVLRQSSSIPMSLKLESVEECLDLLDLRPIADFIVRGSTVEQLKRLTIGVELAAQPSVLFLDEPTSGLDARAAKVIMDGVRKVADSGRTIVCTIHQPSFEVFQVFDRLLLLKRGGETVYFGDLGHRGRAIIDYFQAIHGVSPIPSDDYNPATWMLEVIGAGVGSGSDEEKQVKLDAMSDFVATFQTSAKKAELDAGLNQDGITRPATGVGPVAFEKKRAATNGVQARILLQRSFRTYWRTPDYMLSRAIAYAMLSLLMGLSYRDSDYSTFQGANAGVSLVYGSTVFIGVVAFDAALPLASELRGAFYRERASQTYNAFWYFVSSSIVEIPYVFAVTLIFCSIIFPIAGFRGAYLFLLYWVHSSFHVLLQTYFGELLAIALPDVTSALKIAVILNSFFFNVMGFNPPTSNIPSGYKWVYEILPTKFPFTIITALLFGRCEHDSDFGCKQLEGDLPPQFTPGTTVKEYVKRVFKADIDDIYYNFSLVIVYIVITRVLTLLAMRFINHQRR